MARVIEISDEQFQTIERVAATRGETPDSLVAEWIETLRSDGLNSTYYETEEWFRHLGVSDAEIDAIRREVRDEAETDADTL